MRKWVLVAALALVLLIAGALSFGALRKAYNAGQTLRSDVSAIRTDVEWLRQRVAISPTTGFDSSSSAGDFLFAGHIYGFNGYVNPSFEYGPNFDFSSEPIDVLIQYANDIGSRHVVFGGDSVVGLSENSLNYLQNDLAPRFNGPARFVHGNHDDSAASDRFPADLFHAVFPEPYYFEDIDGIRLIYLRSFLPSGGSGGVAEGLATGERGTEPGLDVEQLDFLATALDDSSYDVALVFLHNGLWLADEPQRLANIDYPDLQPRRWVDGILPILESGRVGGVFAGDGGTTQPALVSWLCGIPHYISGWDLNLRRRPAEFLRIAIDSSYRAEVFKQVIFDGQVFEVQTTRVDLTTPPSCASS